MVMLNITENLFKEAEKYIPGGVNSPVRSFKAIGTVPVFIKKGKGPFIYDESGGKYTDYCLSWGALLLGHSDSRIINTVCKTLKNGTSFGAVTRKEVEFARLIVEAVPSVEKVRLTNSGTEAVMTAIRLARGYTGRKKIVKFEGSYHGHTDSLLVKTGSGGVTFGIPGSLGVPPAFTKETIVIPYNNIEKVEYAAKKYSNDIAGIIIEPVMANCGVVLPEEGFLAHLRKICNKYGILLIFDEVITGFRISYGGAQEYFGVKPDISCFGKIIGGGLPVGAVGGKKEIMDLLAPLGKVYQAGTFSGNPLTVAAGITTLKILKEKGLYTKIEKKTKILCEGIKNFAVDYDIKLKVNYIGSFFSIFFTSKEIKNFNDALMQNKKLFRKFYSTLLENKVYFSPSPFESNFVSSAHKGEDIKLTLKVIDTAFKKIQEEMK